MKFFCPFFGDFYVLLSFANRDNFISSFLIHTIFISFSFLNSLARTSRKLLNCSVGRGHTYPDPWVAFLIIYSSSFEVKCPLSYCYVWCYLKALGWMFPIKLKNFFCITAFLRCFIFKSWVDISYCPFFLCQICSLIFFLPYQLEKEMATHSRILAWRIPWTEMLSRIQFIGMQRVRHDWTTKPLPKTTFQCGRLHWLIWLWKLKQPCRPEMFCFQRLKINFIYFLKILSKYSWFTVLC